MLIHRAGAKHLYIPGGSLGVRACSAGEIGGGVVSTRSVQCDGVDDKIATAATTWGIANTATFSAWIKTSDTTAAIISLSEAGTINNEMLLYVGVVSGKVSILSHKSSGNFNARNSSTTVNDGAWHHVCGVIDNGFGTANLKIYVDGVEETGTTTTAGTPAALSDASPRVVRIGGRENEDPIERLAGIIDDVRIYNVALSPTDVANLAAGQDVTAGLVAYWPLEEGSGTNTVDTVGGNNGTLTNGTTWSTDVPAVLA